MCFFICVFPDEAASDDKKQHGGSTQKDLAVIAGLSPLLLFSPCLIEIELQLFVIPPVSPAVLVTFTGAAFVLRRKPLCFVSSNTSEKKTPVSFSSSDHFVVIVVNKIQLELLLFMQVP